MAQIENVIAAGLLAFEMQEDADYVEENPVLKPYWFLEEANSCLKELQGKTIDVDINIKVIETKKKIDMLKN